MKAYSNGPARRKIVIHDDFNARAPTSEEIVRRTRLEDTSGADIISLCVTNPEMCWYYPARVGEIWGLTEVSHAGEGVKIRRLVEAGVNEIRFTVYTDAPSVRDNVIIQEVEIRVIPRNLRGGS